MWLLFSESNKNDEINIHLIIVENKRQFLYLTGCFIEMQ